MSGFKEAYTLAAADTFDVLGETVSYHDQAGRVKTIQAIVNENAQPLPDGFETTAPEVRTEIDLLISDAPRVRAGDLIVTEEKTFKLADLVDEFGVTRTYTAKRVNE